MIQSQLKFTTHEMTLILILLNFRFRMTMSVAQHTMVYIFLNLFVSAQQPVKSVTVTIGINV